MPYLYQTVGTIVVIATTVMVFSFKSLFTLTLGLATAALLFALPFVEVKSEIDGLYKIVGAVILMSALAMVGNSVKEVLAHRQ